MTTPTEQAHCPLSWTTVTRDSDVHPFKHIPSDVVIRIFSFLQTNEMVDFMVNQDLRKFVDHIRPQAFQTRLESRCLQGHSILYNEHKLALRMGFVPTRGMGQFNFSKSEIQNSELGIITKIYPLITKLDLSRCENINIDGIYHLRTFASLTELNLTGLKVYSEGLLHISQHPLKRLHLSGDKTITDLGLTFLKECPLEFLNLTDCSYITDEGLKHLYDLPLKCITLRGCSNITRAGIDDLRAKFPNALILSDHPPLTTVI